MSVRTLVCYRISDGRVGNTTTHANWEKIDPAKEVAGLGPGYATLFVDQLPTSTDAVDYKVVGDRVVTIPVPRHAKRKQDRKTGYAKLRSLGLTTDQLKAVFGAGAGG